MAELGALIKARRSARKMSLRDLGIALGVTPAYLADIEASRRLPSPELRQRISAVLEIPLEDLQAADNRLEPDLREWIEERPQVISALRTLQSSPDAGMLIQRVTRFLKRRAPQQSPPRGHILTWESELRVIAAESTAWSIETGGDLFGRWVDVPTVLFASKAGPNAERNHAHFRLDVDYVRQMSEVLAADFVVALLRRLALAPPARTDFTKRR